MSNWTLMMLRLLFDELKLLEKERCHMSWLCISHHRCLEISFFLTLPNSNPFSSSPSVILLSNEDQGVLIATFSAYVFLLNLEGLFTSDGLNPSYLIKCCWLLSYSVLTFCTFVWDHFYGLDDTLTSAPRTLVGHLPKIVVLALVGTS